MTDITLAPPGELVPHAIMRGDGGEAQRFILLPDEGLWGGPDPVPEAVALYEALYLGRATGRPIQLLRSGEIRTYVEDSDTDGLILPLAQIEPPQRHDRRSGTDLGPVLVVLDPEALLNLRRMAGAARVTPEQAVRPMSSLISHSPQRPGGRLAPTTIKVADPKGRPVPEAHVQAFTDVDLLAGDEGLTDDAGEIELLFDRSKTIEQLFVRPGDPGLRGHFSANEPTAHHHTIEITLYDFDESDQDCLQHRYAGSHGGGAGVRVGVIDSGIDEGHPALHVSGGFNAVDGEGDWDYGYNGVSSHGTHMAGIIAGQPSPTRAPFGVAPECELFSYRVYARGDTAPHGTFAILNAVIRAVGTDNCDLVNLSLGSELTDPVYIEMDRYIHSEGALAFAAAGNTNRKHVTPPASLDHVVAVAAIGRKGTYPLSSIEAANESEPYGDDPLDYSAVFSPDSDDVVLACPGVGVISSIENGGYAALSGTSQACAAATGRAAQILASAEELRRSSGSERASALWNKVLASARPLGLGLRLEGSGVL